MTTGLQLSSRSIPRRSSAVKVAFGTWTTAVSARARQLDDERRAIAGHALDGYVPTGGARERAADGESEPDAITSGGTLAQLSERLEGGPASRSGFRGRSPSRAGTPDRRTARRPTTSRSRLMA